MANNLSAIAESLRRLADQINAAYPQTTTLVQQFGWNTPALTAKNLAEMATTLAEKLEGIPAENLNAKYSGKPIVEQIDLFRANTLPQMFNGNGVGAMPPYFALLSYIDQKFSPFTEARVDWQKVNDKGVLPKQLASKLRSYRTSISRFDGEFASLGERIAVINQAHEAANELPTDLETLRAANEEIAERRTEAEKNEVLAIAAREKVESILVQLNKYSDEARKLVENTEDAYSAATTKGLGEVFQKRADSLAKSVWMWVGLLLAALGTGSVLGHNRLQVLQNLLQQNASDGKIWLNFLLSALALAAPVWFAWIATKQIGHRFRLSEDYAFKASVAQAYEGYRREAARLDPVFASRLFASALDRIDEAPIRFVEHETYGSPWHEILRRPARGKPQGREAPAVAIVPPAASNSVPPVAANATVE